MFIAIQLLVALTVLSVGLADVYMHNPRGSNDRNCERNVNRNNGNRLFDSQNNNNGGYACPRGVGDEKFQPESGVVYMRTTASDDDATAITQNKRMYYYSGSVLPIEFTSQHGCGSNSKVACEIILQYACEDTLDPLVDDFWPWVQNKAEVGSTYRGKQHFRSGTNIGAPRDGVPIDVNDAATDTIPDNEDNAIADTPADRRFGMQESYDYYQVCQRTQRNNGLYTADQLLRRTDRRATRQNPNGNRHGFECPEERDYYPWWAPSPWIDVAVLTDSAGDSICSNSTVANGDCSVRCQYYLNNTMNFNRKGYCDVDHHSSKVTLKLTNPAWTQNRWYNNPADCTKNGFVWYSVSHADNIQLDNSSFVCAHTQFSRTNQLGNAFNDEIFSQTQKASAGNVEAHVVRGVEANRFMWTIPKIPKSKKTDQTFMNRAYQSCVFRIRYNISSADFPSWPKEAVDPNLWYTNHMVDSRNNSKSADDSNTPLTQDPYIYIGPGDGPKKGDQFVALAVNTNQYARTFQDRSYVFSIKPLPTSSAAQDPNYDFPGIDVTEIKQRLNAGGKIYNVNVRGKRGNIVQTFPSVEYDFVPNALSLSQKDMIHFQWTGSDYNPRRGCNDGEGGPPDLNTYSTAANADQNSRADRSNVVFSYHMANNVPRDYLGYYPMGSNLNNATNYNKKLKEHQDMVADFAPCYDKGKSNTVREQCIDSVMWLAYLNQQLDGVSLELRNNNKCLTQAELDAIPNQDIANNHPLNCAKLNAKPYPYFDGGIMFMVKSGWFPFFSTRNNNFSNRQQIGIICVSGNSSNGYFNCALQNGTGVLQDQNPAVSGRSVPIATSTCDSSASGQKGATGNGAMSCLPSDYNPNASYVTTGETFTVQNGDNDNKGDGNKMGCAIATNSLASLFSSGPKTVEQQVTLAVILLFVGLFTSWAAYYMYNRWRAAKGPLNPFRGDKNWMQQTELEMKQETARYQQVASPSNSPSPSVPASRGSGRHSSPTRQPSVNGSTKSSSIRSASSKRSADNML